MNKEYSSQAILLNHRDMKEADKLLFFITPIYGKVVVHARSIKKLKSKLSAGIGQFDLSHIEYLEWKDNFFILTASNGLRHYNISDLNSLNSCFEVMAVLLKTVAENHDASDIFFAYLLFLEQLEACSKSFKPDLHLDLPSLDSSRSTKNNFSLLLANHKEYNLSVSRVNDLKNIFLLRLFFYLSLVEPSSLDREIGQQGLSISNWDSVKAFYNDILRDKNIYLIPDNLSHDIDIIIRWILETEIGFRYPKKI